MEYAEIIIVFYLLLVSTLFYISIKNYLELEGKISPLLVVLFVLSVFIAYDVFVGNKTYNDFNSISTYIYGIFSLIVWIFFIITINIFIILILSKYTKNL